MLTGLARDGGLYVPEVWPQLSQAQIAGFFGKPYWEVAVEVLRPFIGGEISDADLGRMAVESMPPSAIPPWCRSTSRGRTSSFSSCSTARRVAFKDVTMQLLARLMDHVLARAWPADHHRGRDLRRYRRRLSVDAFAGRDNIDLIVLFPNGRISDVQRRMSDHG